MLIYKYAKSLRTLLIVLTILEMVTPMKRPRLEDLKTEQLNQHGLKQKFKVGVTFHTFQNEIFSTEYCHGDKDVIFALLVDKTLYRSTDGGVKWESLHKTIKKVGGKKHQGLVMSIVKNKHFPDQILFLGSSGISYFTEDCGKTFKILDHGKKLQKIRFHPTQRTYMLATSRKYCKKPRKKYCVQYTELILTKDHVKFETIATFVHDFDWAYQVENPNKKVPLERIFIIREKPRTKTSDQTFNQRSWSHRLDFVYSDNFFKQSTVLVENGNQFAMTSKFVYILKLEDYKRQSVKLHAAEISPVMIQRPVSTPLKETLQQGYTILHISHSMVFVHIKTESIQGAKMGDLFVSDSTGHRLSLVAENNVRGPNSICDIIKVPSIEGVYLINVYDKTFIELLKGAIMGEQDGQQQRMAERLDQYKKTQMTFDTGATWKPLQAPVKRMDGKKFKCEYDCFLHLHMFSSEGIPRVYSLKSALGLIIGHGNVGARLSHSSVGVFLSRNGGNKWYHIADGKYIYEIGNSGGFIVMAKHGRPTDEIEFSYNFGETWIVKIISSKKFYVSNIVMEDENQGTKFLVLGNQGEGADMMDRSVSISLDFSKAHIRDCRGADRADHIDSDYTYFQPMRSRKDPCIRGHQEVYIRRKASAECLLPKTDGVLVTKKNCYCKEHDWICDRDFERNERGVCVRVDGKTIDKTPPPKCWNNYTVQRGYRKTAGNTCEGGVDHSDLSLVCPFSARILFFRNFIFILFFGILLYTMMQYKTNIRAYWDGTVTAFINKGKDFDESNRMEYKPIGNSGPGMFEDDEEDKLTDFEDLGKSPTDSSSDSNSTQVALPFKRPNDSMSSGSNLEGDDSSGEEDNLMI